MAEPFVPIFPVPSMPSAAGAAPRVKVVSQENVKGAFTPMAALLGSDGSVRQPGQAAAGTAVAKPGAQAGQAAHPGGVASASATAAGAQACVEPPKVTFDRDGDRITRIHVVCGCGQVTELHCVY